MLVRPITNYMIRKSRSDITSMTTVKSADNFKTYSLTVLTFCCNFKTSSQHTAIFNLLRFRDCRYYSSSMPLF